MTTKIRMLYVVLPNKSQENLKEVIILEELAASIKRITMWFATVWYLLC